MRVLARHPHAPTDNCCLWADILKTYPSGVEVDGEVTQATTGWLEVGGRIGVLVFVLCNHIVSVAVSCVERC